MAHFFRMLGMSLLSMVFFWGALSAQSAAGQKDLTDQYSEEEIRQILQQTKTWGSQAEACMMFAKWGCAADALFKGPEFLDSHGLLGSCISDENHGCGYFTFGAIVLGLNAAVAEDGDDSRSIALRALNILNTIELARIEADLQNNDTAMMSSLINLHFDALIVRSCLKIEDRECVSEFASKVQTKLSELALLTSEDVEDVVSDFMELYQVEFETFGERGEGAVPKVAETVISALMMIQDMESAQ